MREGEGGREGEVIFFPQPAESEKMPMQMCF